MEAASTFSQAVKSPRPQQPKAAAAVMGAAAATDKAAAQVEAEAQALAKRQAEVRLTCTLAVPATGRGTVSLPGLPARALQSMDAYGLPAVCFVGEGHTPA